MERQFSRYGSALLFAGVLALAGCSGDRGATGASGAKGDTGDTGATGATGPAGSNGLDGTDLTATARPESCEVCHTGAGAKHQALYDSFTDGLNPATTKLAITIDGVASTLNADGTTYTSTLTFTITKGGQPYVDAGLAGLKQKRFTATEYDPATRKFTTATAVSFSSPTHVASGQYTATAAAAKFAPEASAHAMVYVYVGDTLVLPAEGHYNLMDNVASAGRVYGTVDYQSAANVAGCQKCHPTPYAKHGYRAATVAGLTDFSACMACHTGQRTGEDFIFQLLADDPAATAALEHAPNGDAIYTAAQESKYAYVATVMNDTHMSHAMEFPYPQSMANCVACHEGKLDQILSDANFTITTCKSCHPVTGSGNAPSLKSVVPHTSLDFYTYAGDCSYCHKAGTGFPRFSDIHSGYDKQIYANATTKLSSVVTTTVDSASFDKATNKVTATFSLAGANAAAIVKPTVVASLYGYDTKDFIVSGHNGQADGTRNLEWTEGAMQRSDPTKSANSDRLTVSPATAAAGVKVWTVTADLSLWASKISDGSVNRIEIAFLPSLGLDQTLAVSATNPAIAAGGATTTVDLVAGGIAAAPYGKAIVNPAKCNSCHEALGTTFHSPAYGSAGVVGCRICHTVRDGGAHLEMQSRSIDSYVHAIHSFQAFDVASIDFSDPVAAMRYSNHVEHIYPNFTITNCESCHEEGTFEVPDQYRSMPSVLSKAAANATWNRAIGAVPMYVTGPASRACGSCHRAQLINKDDAGALAAFNSHAASFGFMLETTSATATSDLDAAIAEIFSIFK